MFEPNQRVKDVQRVAVEAPMYLVELLVSFKGVKRVEVPEERIRPS